jgi:hypothetical protein
MKLLTIYSVVNDKKFLVELIDDELTLSALNSVIQDRVKKQANVFSGIIVHQGTDEAAIGFHRLVFKNTELKSKILPAECLRETQEPIHLVPYDLDPSIPFTVVVKVSRPDILPTYVSCMGLIPK